jgi:guanine nucleotide exchange factor
MAAENIEDMKVEDLINDLKRNKTKIFCKHCNSLILLESSADYVEEEHEIPLIKNKTGCENNEKIQKFWLVNNMMKFENIGFTNTVNNRKYLICADCEIGPLGFQNLDEPNKLFLAIQRIKHDQT